MCKEREALNMNRRGLLYAGLVSPAAMEAQVRRSSMKLAIGSDHAGFPPKGPLIKSYQSISLQAVIPCSRTQVNGRELYPQTGCDLIHGT